MKKRIPIIILIVLILGCIISIVFDNYNKKQIIFGGSTIVEYSGNNIKIKNSSKINNKNNYQKYKVYDGNSFVDSYIEFFKGENFSEIEYDLYSTSLEKLNISNYLLAYRGNIKLSVARVETTFDIEEADEVIIKQALSNISFNFDDLNVTKTILDLDNNNKKEQIFTVNNFNLIGESSQLFCNVFLVDDEGNIVEIVRQLSSVSTAEDIKLYNFAYAVDIDEDNKYEIVLSNFYEDSNTYFDIYKFNASKKLIKKL